MTQTRPYHHGNLRQAVLDRAAVVLRERGAAGLSLRELSADVGVSHAAPRRHFADRQALLDAVAADGFARLGTRLREAVDAHPRYADRLRAAATAYLDFGLTEANLVELMFAHQRGAGGAQVRQGATDAFEPLLDVFRHGRQEGVVADGDAERLGLLLVATVQGITNLVACGVVPAAEAGALLDAAVGRFPGTGA